MRQPCKSLPRDFEIPPLELKSFSLGTKKFQEGNHFWNSYLRRNQHDTKRQMAPFGRAVDYAPESR